MKDWRGRLKGRLNILRTLFRFLWEERLWWMIPLVAVLLLVGGLLIVAQHSALAPFIYTLI